MEFPHLQFYEEFSQLQYSSIKEERSRSVQLSEFRAKASEQTNRKKSERKHIH